MAYLIKFLIRQAYQGCFWTVAGLSTRNWGLTGMSEIRFLAGFTLRYGYLAKLVVGVTGVLLAQGVNMPL
jgi:hypothetical protein